MTWLEFFENHLTFIEKSSYDLVLLDTLYLKNRPWTLPEGDIEPGKFEEDHDLGGLVLEVTQLYIGLISLCEKGSLVLRVSLNNTANSMTELIILTELFDTVEIVKPSTCHQIRSSCYCVLSGFKLKSKNVDFVQKKLLSFLVKAHQGTAIVKDLEMLFFGSQGIDVNVYGDFLIELCRETWEIQLENLIKLNQKVEGAATKLYQRGSNKFGKFTARRKKNKKSNQTE